MSAPSSNSSSVPEGRKLSYKPTQKKITPLQHVRLTGDTKKKFGSASTLSMYSSVDDLHPPVLSNRSSSSPSMLEGSVKSAIFESLQEMLSTPRGFDCYRQFLESEHCEENVDFWKAVEDFRACEQEQMEKKAEEIHEIFIKDGAAHQISLPSSISGMLKSLSLDPAKKQKRESFGARIFDMAQKSVMDLLAGDSYHRFVRTDMYEQFVIREGIHGTTLSALIRKLRNPKHGIPLKERKLPTKVPCFTGIQLFTWVREKMLLSQGNALRLCQILQNQKYFFAVQQTDNKEFKMDQTYYTFASDEDPNVLNLNRRCLNTSMSPTELSTQIQQSMENIFLHFSSADGSHLDYKELVNSGMLYDITDHLLEEMQAIDLSALRKEELGAFLANVHNLLFLHSVLVMGYPVTAMEHRRFSKLSYLIAGEKKTLDDLREMMFTVVEDPRVLFAIYSLDSEPSVRVCDGSKLSSFMSSIQHATTTHLINHIDIDMEKKIIFLSKVFSAHRKYFPEGDTELAGWVSSFLKGPVKKNIEQLLEEKEFKIAFSTFNWKPHEEQFKFLRKQSLPTLVGSSNISAFSRSISSIPSPTTSPESPRKATQ